MKPALWIATFVLAAPAWAQGPPASCEVELSPADSLQSIYPAGSRRRNETGAVTLALRIDVSSARPVEVTLVKSSGFEELDAAALRIGGWFRVKTDCLNATVQRVIHFEKEPDPPLQAGTDVIFMGETHIWVEEL